MNIRIIAVGKDKDAWLSAALDEYLKRLKPFGKIEMTRLPDISIKQTGSSKIVIEKECEAIRRQIAEGDFCILLDESGESKDSQGFSELLTDLSTKKRIVFIIGGVFGTDARLKQEADICFSLSRLTFTHRMSRLILVEQIYRAMMIINGRSYHI
ncbi:MAG: 23S rRNA (pseudouridine(1915)-N(3))-methyltransferase RlmH [Candidatus Cloacimonetes bacterium]|jgi:23S rRNA (pseudouridine1915-N3)-methyltransferase|nr:23S rRNA (pseudouridine(1915)-N(3))-methyltransferase RlmH [Candidatus Cloacimonadota bacterium]